ncbi:hypothetical protein LK07_29490 [Streptomyces pluripotens]|uniref:Uncharacterized protein n=1 Tax=Streptomyces pluripotens TaxID=1355015 RepID=A0A221P5V4_9ACTN|nr:MULTISPECIES: hypothetical protein [Streptomyces]ARP73227.1 hypothetical protein LK06_028320 [Streptomyces pluripotens]ASN27476.1 hypothetical protein LK07_29490 [Streptomyces pluripotens]KIE24417.1 hypothetical protein LK08_24540 [Streptomyces sp. MUSC 125]MCH0560487.1 hypothetical protein [Streptomyces sp. MUM 16J]
MPTTVLTDRERTAVQAYLRLLHTVRAAFDDSPDDDRPAVVPPAVLAEAEQALACTGLAGNEEVFFRLLRGWCPPAPAAGRPPLP